MTKICAMIRNRVLVSFTAILENAVQSKAGWRLI